MILKLVDDGDGPERHFCSRMLDLFPAYETVWAAHIVPLTYRIRERQVKWVRLGLPDVLRQFASYHYNVFYRLGLASDALADGDAISTVPGFQMFCIHLRAAMDEGIGALMESLGVLVQKYGKNGKLYKFEDWVRKWKCTQLEREHRQVIEGIEGYRNLAAHWAPLIMYAGMVPRPELLDPFVRKRKVGRKHHRKGNPLTKELRESRFFDLAQVARFILHPEELDREYIQARTLAEGYFNRALRVCNELWIHMAQALEGLAKSAIYGDAKDTWDKELDTPVLQACIRRIGAHQTGGQDGFRGGAQGTSGPQADSLVYAVHQHGSNQIQDDLGATGPQGTTWDPSGGERSS